MTLVHQPHGEVLSASAEGELRRDDPFVLDTLLRAHDRTVGGEVRGVDEQSARRHMFAIEENWPAALAAALQALREQGIR